MKIVGALKKIFMSAKRLGKDSNTLIDEMLEFLNKEGKSSENLSTLLLSLKVTISSIPSNEHVIQSEATKEEIKLFDIKKLNDLEDKMIRGSAKKIYMAGKRANKNSKDVIEDILKELSNKLDEKSRTLIERLK